MGPFIYLPIQEVPLEDALPLWTDPEVLRYTGITAPYTLEDLRVRVRLLKGADAFAVQRDGKIIGMVACERTNRLLGQYRLFYLFQKSVWGQGCATAALGWLLEFMNGRQRRMTFSAKVIADNAASERLLQKLGFSLRQEEAITFRGEKTFLREYVLRKVR